MTSIATQQARAPGAAAEQAAPAGRRRLGRKGRERLAAALFLLPDGLGLALFVVLPMLLSFLLSFFQVSGFGSYEWIGVGNYERMVNDPYFWSSMGVTAKYVVLMVPTLFVVSLSLGVLMKQMLPGMSVYRTALFLPHMLSLVVVGLLWKFMLDDQTGVVNKAGGELGLGARSWLGDPGLALYAVIAVTVWYYMGYYMIIFLAGLNEIPRELYEAAKIDGAGPWTSFRRITWPLLKPTSFFVLIVSTVAAITGTFDLIFVLTDGGPANGTAVAMFYIYQQAFVFGEYGYAAALGSFLVLVMVALSWLIFKATKGGRFDDEQ